MRDAGRAVRRQPHGRDRDCRRRRAGGRPVDDQQRRLAAGGRADSVFGADDARGHVRRRRAGLPLAASTSCWSSTPATSRRTTAGSGAASPASATPSPSNASSRYALIAVQGPEARSGPAAADRRRPRRPQVLLVRARRGRRRPRHRLAHRLHRRGRLRDLRARPARPSALWKALLDAGPAGGHRPGRPRRARHAAPRSVDAAVRQRHGRDHDAARGRPRLDRRLEEGRFHRQGGARGAEGGAASTQARRLRDDRSRHRPRTAIRSSSTASRPATVTSGTQTPFLKKAIGMALRAGGGVGSPARPSRSTSAAGAWRPRSCRCRSTSGHQPRYGGAPDVSGGLEVHEGPRVGPQPATARPRSASPTTRRSSSATSSSSSCRTSAAPSSRARSSAPSSR